MSEKDIFTLGWEGFEIEVSYVSSYSKTIEEQYSYAMAHIEIRTLSPKGAALPVTQTGYKSIFIAKPEIDRYGGADAFIRQALDEAAQAVEWKSRAELQRQYCLF